MKKYSEKFTLETPIEVAFDRCLDILSKTNQYTIKKEDRKAGKIELSSNVSMRSWGETISMSFQQITLDITQIEIMSSSRLKTTLFDGGKNKENVTSLIQAFKANDPAQANKQTKGLWQELFGSTGAVKLGKAFSNFLDADTLEKRQAFIEKHPELLSEEAIAYIDEVLSDEQDEEVIEILNDVRYILCECKKYGVEAAFSQINAGSLVTEVLNKADKLLMANEFKTCIDHIESNLVSISANMYPNDWVKLHLMLGTSYKTIARHHPDNWESAVNAYSQALTVATPENMPTLWTLGLRGMGDTYVAWNQNTKSESIRQEHLQKAINAYQLALEQVSKANNPITWAQLKTQLGFAYSSFPAQYTEHAIEEYIQALEVYDPVESPEEWAWIMQPLANLYRNRELGDRAENIEKSITICQEVLDIITFEKNPNLWINTAIVLAVGYSKRVFGNKKENLEQATKLYESLVQRVPQDSSIRITLLSFWKDAADELAGMDIWKSSESMHKQSLMKFIQAETWSDAKQILGEHPELLNDETDSLLNQMTEQTPDEGWASIYKEHLALLRRCRLVGTEVAFYEKQGNSVNPDLVSQLLDPRLGTIHLIKPLYLAIEEHPEFLTDATLQMLEEQLKNLHKGNDLVYYGKKSKLQGIYNLLHRCRQIGTDEAFAELILEPIPFPFPEDAPEGLKAEQKRLAAVTASFSPEERANFLGI